MILTGRIRSAGRKSCPTDAVSIRNPQSTNVGSSPVVRVDRSATDCLSHGMANCASTPDKGQKIHPFLETPRPALGFSHPPVLWLVAFVLRDSAAEAYS
jgi:hypothetical protein